MSYCTNCGAQLAPGARFCTSCGTAVPSAAQPAPAAAAGTHEPHSQQPQAQQPQAYQPQAQQPANPHQVHRPAARVSSGAFASVPVSDYVRDGLALFLLLISMFMVWTYGTTSAASVAATRIDVILITLVSMFSVGIPYLWRSGVFGQGWDYRRTQLARLAANAPYFVLVAVYLVLELINRAGLGPAMAFGLAGAVLAAQPRRAELGSSAADVSTDKRWGIALLGFAVVVGVLTVVQFIERMVTLQSSEWGGTFALVLLGAANVALLVWTAIGASRGHDVRRLIGIGVGVAGTGMALLALLPAVTIVSLTFHAFTPGLSLFFWPAFGALAASPSVARICTAAKTPDQHAALARTRVLIILAIAVLGLMVAVSALALISFATYAGYGVAANTVPWVVVIFLAVVGAVGGFVAKAALKQHTRQSYLITAGYAGVLFVLGLVIVIVSATSYMVWTGTLGLLAGFALPVGLVLSMFGSASQREAFRAAGHAGHSGFTFENPAPAAHQPEGTTPGGAYQPDAAFQPAADVHGAPAADAPGHGTGTAVLVDQDLSVILAESADPASPPARLYEIAAEYPQARSVIAGNPAAYPALLTWLAEQQDPEIDAALARRIG